jgi:hypothetical protein
MQSHIVAAPVDLHIFVLFVPFMRDFIFIAMRSMARNSVPAILNLIARSPEPPGAVSGYTCRRVSESGPRIVDLSDRRVVISCALTAAHRP